MAYYSQLNQADKAKAVGNDNADASNGVLFSKKDGTKTPLQLVQQFLIIGVGGSGTQTVNRIKGELKRQYSWNRDQLAFLAIDTDDGGLRSLVNLDPGEKYMITDTDGINRRHNIPDNRLDFTKEWIHPDFHENFGSGGANQNRVVCHAKMFDGGAGNFADKKLIEKITTVTDPFTGGETEVIIILGVSGGTGSGGLINIAHFVRKVLAAKGKFEVTGYFYMPDVFKYPAYTDSKKSNGYAALKELDYYYCARQRRVPEFLKDHTATALQVDRDNLLYDTVFLVSGSVRGATVQPYNTAIGAVKESIVNMLTENQVAIAAAADHDGDDPVFMMSQFKANSDRERGNVITHGYEAANGYPNAKESNDFFGEDVYNYNAIGVGTVSVPTELIKCYAVDQVVQNVLRLNNDAGSVIAPPGTVAVPTWRDGALSSTNGEEKIKALLSFNPDKVRETIKDNVKLTLPADLAITREDAISGAAKNKIRSGLGIDGTGRKQEDFTDAIYRVIDQQYAQFELELTKFLKKYGPYTFCDLYKGVGSDHAYNGLSMVLSDYLSAVSDMPANNQEALERAHKRLSETIFGALPPRLSDWINADVENEKTMMKYNISSGIFGVGCYYDTHYLTKARTLCEECCEFAEVLKGLNDAYGNLAHDFSDFNQYSNWLNNHASGRVYDCIQSQGDYNWAKGIVDNTLSNMNYKSIREALVDAFMQNRKKWIDWNETEGNVPRKTFDTFITNQVQFTSEITVVSYVQHQVASNANMTTAATNLVKALISKSEPLFKQETASTIDMTDNCNRYLLIPEGIFSGTDGATVQAAFQQACNGVTPPITMQESAGVDNFVLFTQKGGLPIYAIAELDSWEDAYIKDTGRLHRNESGVGDFDPVIGLEWKNYPYLSHKTNPRVPDATGAICAEGKFLIRELDPLWKEAVNIGLIQERQDAEGKYYYEYYNLIHRPDWTIQFDENTWPKGADGLFIKGMNMFDYFAQQNGKTLADITKVIRLEGQGAFSLPNPIRANALDWAKRSLRKNVPMYLEVKKTLAKVRDISKHIDDLNASIIARGLAAKYIACGILREIDKDNHEWRLIDYPVPGLGESKSIAELRSTSFDDDKLSQNRLDQGIVYPVLVSMFQRETANDATIQEFYKNTWKKGTATKEGRAKFQHNLASFVAEAQAFLNRYDGADNDYARTTLMGQLPGDKFAVIRDCYKELLTQNRRLN